MTGDVATKAGALAAPAGAPVRVAVVGERRLYRQGLVAALNRCGRIEVILEAEQVRDLQGVAAPPHVVVVDAASTPPAPRRLPGWEAALVGVGVPTGRVGDFAACVRVDACVDELVAVVLDVACTVGASGDDAAGHARPRLPPLTARETEVLELVDRALTNPEIARRLSIEVATVKNHMHSVLRKLGVRRRAQAAAWFRGATWRPATRGPGTARNPKDGSKDP